jgi:phosphatidylglycerophosphate synthase
MDLGSGGVAVKVVIPWSMVISRAVMGPVLVAITTWGVAGWVLSTIVVLTLVDDIADGMLARHWGTASPALRLADSCADTVFYLESVMPFEPRQGLRYMAGLVGLLSSEGS